MISAEFLLSSLVVVLLPGTGALYTVSTALLHGRRAGAWASLGCTLGTLPHLAATLLGLAAVLQTHAMAFQWLRHAGAAWLLYMAWATWRDGSALALNAAGSVAAPASRAAVHVWRAVLLNLLNPKLTLFFLAYLPQFVSPQGGSPLQQLLGLGAVFMALTFGVFLAYGLLAHVLRRRMLASAPLRNGLRKGFAAAFAAMGLRLGMG